MTDIRYPTDKMDTVAQKLSTILSDALTQHNTLVSGSIQTSIDSLPTSIKTTFQEHFSSWEQQIQNSYGHLQFIATTLSGATAVVTDQEQQFTNSFQTDPSL